MIQWINTRFGTYRGLIRLLLADIELKLGITKRFNQVDFSRVDRLVMVCLGNVCRSPYAELIAKEQGVNNTSFGLSTTPGIPAYKDAINTAKVFNKDLSSHRAIDFIEFDVQDSDLLLVMEVRQARELEYKIKNSKAQIALLGCWANPRRPHIHDPMTLSKGYFKTCYETIESAVLNLCEEFKRSRA